MKTHNRIAIRRRDARAGDVILDAIGRPYFRVLTIRLAGKANVVFTGDQLCAGPPSGGHGDTLIPILRVNRKDSRS